MAVRETGDRKERIKSYLKKAKSSITEVYRQVNNDIILHKGIPPYLKKGKDQ